MTDGARFSSNITPAGDAEYDEFNQIINDLVDTKIAGLIPYLATVTATRTGDARIRVQAWEDDADGQEDKIRAAGFLVNAGDNVVVLPIGGGEAVIISKLVNSNEDKKVIGRQEMADNAIDSGMLANESIKTEHLNRSGNQQAVSTQTIRDGAVTPAKLSQTYATENYVDSATNNMATQSYVNNKLNGYQPSGNYVTQSQLTTAIGNIPTGGGGNKSFEEVKNNGTTLKEYFQQIQLFFNCTNNYLGSKIKKKKPCESYRVLRGF